MESIILDIQKLAGGELMLLTKGGLYFARLQMRERPSVMFSLFLDLEEIYFKDSVVKGAYEYE